MKTKIFFLVLLSAIFMPITVLATPDAPTWIDQNWSWLSIVFVAALVLAGVPIKDALKWIGNFVDKLNTKVDAVKTQVLALVTSIQALFSGLIADLKTMLDDDQITKAEIKAYVASREQEFKSIVENFKRIFS